MDWRRSRPLSRSRALGEQGSQALFQPARFYKEESSGIFGSIERDGSIGKVGLTS